MERDPEDMNRDQGSSNGSKPDGETTQPIDGPGGDEGGQGATSQDEPNP
jgi:hypothetical protein